MTYQKRTMQQALTTRNDETQPKTIEGYFAVFNQETELFPGYFEEIAPEALATIAEDVRALINHDSNYVLGRTKAQTLSLTVDSKGLFGSIKINERDSEAVNLYERVKRGDVDQCSFGFEILDQSISSEPNGKTKVRITEIKLYEVSVVTFPAYEATEVSARSGHLQQQREIDQKREKVKELLRSCY